MPTVELDLDSTASPEAVIAGLTDFSERRPDIWPGLNRKMFEVYATGDTWADVREGNNDKIWAKERYDWSTPGVVTWTVKESPFSNPGSYVSAKVTPREGGSHVHLTWSRTAKKPIHRLLLGVIALTRGAPVRASFRKGLANIERAAGS